MSKQGLRQKSAGTRLREALKEEKPLQIVGAINAYAALMAERTGYKALYLSGSGVASASYGLPDLGITNLENVLEDVRRITSATNLPLLVDVDTGFGGTFGIARTVKEMIRAGAAGIHIEDQIESKRCGHRPNKTVVSQEEMVARIKVAVDARTDPDFVIMARTDSLAQLGIERATERCLAYKEAGADMFFPEAVTELSQYKLFANSLSLPILANITEFGVTPLFTLDQLREAGVGIALYPLSAFRAMNAAALQAYQVIRTKGTQAEIIKMMQTRQELYDFLNYYEYEKKLDDIVSKTESGREG
jgi:methylisocitrate lyase